jgi:hypothetical protein
VMSSAAVKRYWTRVAELGCVVCGGPAEIAHCAGKPSVVERIQEPKAKGKKLARMDWLVLPACAYHHRLSHASLDRWPTEFEIINGRIADHIDRISTKLGVDVWALSQQGRK